MRTRTLFAIAAAMILVGIFLVVFQFNDPQTECVTDGGATSGFFDSAKKCPVSIASYNKIAKEDSRFKVERVAGLALVGAGLVTSVVALRRRKRDPAAVDPQPVP
jgi:hypothetical protein